MNIKLIICSLILVGTVKINAYFRNIQNTENIQDIVVQQEKIKLPWSDCTEIYKLSKKNFSFSEKQIRKENKVYEEYRKFYLDHRSPANFSMHFAEKENENNRTEIIISNFFKFCEDNFQTGNNKSSSLNYNIKRQQEQWFNNIKNENYKIYYKQKYHNYALLPSYKK